MELLRHSAVAWRHRSKSEQELRLKAIIASLGDAKLNSAWKKSNLMLPHLQPILSVGQALEGTVKPTERVQIVSCCKLLDTN